MTKKVQRSVALLLFLKQFFLFAGFFFGFRSGSRSFFGSMKDFVLMSWPWAAGVLLLIAVIMAVVNSRRKTG